MGRFSTHVDDLYLTMAKELLTAPKVGNTRELNNVKLILKDITNNIVSVRGISPSYLFGELLWYFSGDNSLDYISQFSSFWNRISDDGKTCNSAYGFLILKKHGFDQLQKVIKILKDDPLSRRAKININFPNKHVDTTKDEPCTMSLHFMIRKNKLDCTAIMRSNDIWFGFPYDIAFFTELQKYIARELNVGYGIYTHFAVSFHMYDRDADKLNEIVTNPISTPVEFNRTRFYEKLPELYQISKDHGKSALMTALKDWCIYEEEKHED